MTKEHSVKKEATPSISEQIIAALDGRTRRWLSFEVRIGEYDISQKLNGHKAWKEEELKAIEDRLNFKIIRPQE